MRLRILGPLEVWDGTEWQSLGAPKWRALLAALVVRPGLGVSVQQLIDDVWGDDPPRGAVNQVHGYVARVRRALGDTDGQILASRSPGYTLRLEDDDVDARRFEALTAQGMTAQRRGDPEAAARLLAEALDLWRGPALADVPPTLLVQAEADRLEERRLAALETRIDADLDLGRHADLVPELQAATAEHPLREHLWTHLMLALYRSGRQADALDAYQRLYQILDGDVGVEPDRRVRHLHERILRGDPVLDLESARAPDPDRSQVVPRQLPAAVRHFAGREPQIAELDGLAAQSWQAETTAIAVVTGTAGVGKTSTVVHWAHRVADQFSDGQLYVNLRGFSPSGRPTTPSEAIRGILDALAVPPQRMPATIDAQAGLYRSLLAGRRMLVVLDNAHDVDQVRPLLPGSSGCVVVVTSRDQLSGLIASEGAHSITLDVLTDDEAYGLLNRYLGPDRLTIASAAAARLVERCARLPLALSIAAARAAIDPDLSLPSLASQLADSRSRLDQLDAGEHATNLRAVLSWSYRGLSPEAARLFRLLALHPGPDVTAAVVASLVDRDVPDVRRTLRELTGAHLVAEYKPTRFAFHDLLRAYATELGARVDSDAERHDATQRLLDHYLYTAHRGVMLLDPHRRAIALDRRAEGVRPECLSDDDQAAGWYAAEHQVLLAVVDLAARGGFDRHTWQLAWTMSDFLDHEGHWADWRRVGAVGLDGASRLEDPTGRAHSHRNLARACARLGLATEAHDQFQRALDVFQELDDDHGQADAHFSLSWMLGQQGEHAEALVHAQESLELYQRTGNRSRQARALNTVGWYQTLLGQHDQTVRHCQEALALLQEVDDLAGQAAVWDTLGVAHHRLGNYQDAIGCFQESLARYQHHGNRYSQAEILSHRAETEQTLGEIRAARATWKQALDILDELGHPTADEVRARLDALARTDRGASGTVSRAAPH